MNTPRYDVDEVRIALRSQVRVVLVALGYDTHGHRNELESARCPARTHTSARALVVNVRKAVWRCHSCETGGDMLALIAASRRLDSHRDFAEVLHIGAQIAGVRPIEGRDDDAEARRLEIAKLVERDREREEREAQLAEAERVAAESGAEAAWQTLDREGFEATTYLRSRGIDPLKLPAEAMRVSRAGVVVPLRDHEGTIINIVTRRWPRLGNPKVLGCRSCRTEGTLIGSPAHVKRDDDVVLCEGVADALTAAMIWPNAIVLGAHGANNLPKLAEPAARAVVKYGGRLLIAVHNDAAGARTAAAAALIAVRIGLAVRGDLHVLKMGTANDLNDAWRAGWRPSV